ncbi:MAG: terminase [Candidatus Omnitrophica bacterium CG11_big_fil_rev_8_21_14_0_20_41_12]|nr:MAG: terminase [Candidatus Omnitrophica bacterium CG11_big_fil_rev_8_21_14_0_20_41_12]
MAKLSAQNPERDLINDMVSISKDPYDWVLYSFEWGKGELLGFDGPDVWQKDLLCAIRDGLLTSNEAIRLATASGNGVGKSALVSWIILWSLSTFEDTRGIVTANTENQLRTKTWAELAKWYRLFIAKHWFTFTATAIYSVDPEHEKTWRVDQIPWSEHNSEAFAGLHNKGKRIIVIMDEASAIPDIIWEVTEGALTDEGTEIIWAVFGNPTRNTGRFHSCFAKSRNRWKTWQIDSQTVKITNKEQLSQWIGDYGIDSDWVRVHVLGKFPKASDLQFIPTDIAEAAAGRKLGENSYYWAPKIIGLDPAWTGGDNIVIYLRQGLMAKKLAEFQKNDDDSKIAGALAHYEDAEKADAVFIDQGYGTGIYSFGKTLNRNWTLVNFGAKSGTPGFANKRAEIWGMLKQWLIEGGCVPKDPKMIVDLTGPESHINIRDCIVLESKDSMRKRGLASPGNADALALTFAFPVKAKNRLAQQIKEFTNDKYDVLGD